LKLNYLFIQSLLNSIANEKMDCENRGKNDKFE
jgi:hypothetical protein